MSEHLQYIHCNIDNSNCVEIEVAIILIVLILLIHNQWKWNHQQIFIKYMWLFTQLTVSTDTFVEEACFATHESTKKLNLQLNWILWSLFLKYNFITVSEKGIISILLTLNYLYFIA